MNVNNVFYVYLGAHIILFLEFVS